MHGAAKPPVVNVRTVTPDQEAAVDAVERVVSEFGQRMDEQMTELRRLVAEVKPRPMRTEILRDEDGRVTGSRQVPIEDE
jgi:hypothetical protein